MRLFLRPDLDPLFFGSPLRRAAVAVGALMLRAAGEPPPKGGQPPPAGLVETWVAASLLDLVVFLPFVVLLAVMLVRSGRWERKVIREELASEAAPAVLPGERAAIARDGAFRARRIEALHRRTSAALVRLQHELAFRKRRVRDRGDDPERDPLVARWRDEIALLRARAA